MSIRFKLLLSYLAMLIVPMILTGIAAVVILVIFVSNAQRPELGLNFMKNLTVNAAGIYIDINRTTFTNPDKLMDVKYLEELDKELSGINTGMAVEKDGKLVYISKFMKNPEFLSKIENYNTRYVQKSTLYVDNEPYNVLENSFTFSDNTPGSILLLTNVGPIGRLVGKYFVTLILAALIILALTNGLLTFLVSRSITKPLKLLKLGAQQIKEGNLNFGINCKSNDEIGELCGAFEEMRYKLKQAVDTQLQYEENRKELISTISHDLKTPITAIKGYVEGIMDGVADSPDKMNKYVKTIYAKSEDMDRLIDDLFLFSKLDLKKVPFNFEKVDIKKYFEDCIDELRVDMENKGMQLELSGECSDNMLVIADREKLKRVIINIVNNAVKYMDKENGNISIRLKDVQEAVVVQVEDNGQGITAEEIPLIFERFYRADPSRNSSTGGSGLGLAIAKQVIEGHGGAIWAKSEYGAGTSIFFTLKKA